MIASCSLHTDAVVAFSGEKCPLCSANAEIDRMLDNWREQEELDEMGDE